MFGDGTVVLNGEQKMKIKLLEKRTKTGYTTFGSVYAAGELPADGAMFSLSNERGEHVPMQSRITERTILLVFINYRGLKSYMSKYSMWGTSIRPRWR